MVHVSEGPRARKLRMLNCEGPLCFVHEFSSGSPLKFLRRELSWSVLFFRNWCGRGGESLECGVN